MQHFVQSLLLRCHSLAAKTVFHDTEWDELHSLGQALACEQQQPMLAFAAAPVIWAEIRAVEALVQVACTICTACFSCEHISHLHLPARSQRAMSAVLHLKAWHSQCLEVALDDSLSHRQRGFDAQLAFLVALQHLSHHHLNRAARQLTNAISTSQVCVSV